MNICKHIHACARKVYTSSDDKENVELEINISEQQFLIQMKPTTVQQHTTVNNNEEIISKVKLILGLSSTTLFSDSQKEKVNQ